MKRIDFVLVFMLVILLPVGCQPQVETADTVLQKVVAAHGTEQALHNVKGLLFHGHIQSLIENDHGKLWMLYRQPGQLRVVAEMSKYKEDRLYLQGQGWTDAGTGFAKAAGLALDLMKFQTEHLGLPYALLDGKYQVRTLEDILPNQPVKLVLTDGEGVETNITVDPDRWLIRTVERELVVKESVVRFLVTYEDYRLVKGVQLPFRIQNFVNGNPVGRSDFQSVQTNPSLPENVFSAPELKAEKDGKSSA